MQFKSIHNKHTHFTSIIYFVVVGEEHAIYFTCFCGAGGYWGFGKQADIVTLSQVNFSYGSNVFQYLINVTKKKWKKCQPAVEIIVIQNVYLAENTEKFRNA